MIILKLILIEHYSCIVLVWVCVVQYKNRCGVGVDIVVQDLVG
jgi:hypothetical protein